jgi:hypothetical protein
MRQNSVICDDIEKIHRRHNLSIEMPFQPREDAARSRTDHGGTTMKRNLLLALLMAVMLGCSGRMILLAAHMNAAEKNAFTPDAIPYGPAPAFVPAGAQLAVLEGNPGAASGDYTVRLKMPDGYRIAPHWHPNRENVTIISGTFKVGMGDQFDESKMGAFPAGSFAYLDPTMHHYAMASGEVVVQVHGISPLQFNYVNSDDDPSKKK